MANKCFFLCKIYDFLFCDLELLNGKCKAKTNKFKIERNSKEKRKITKTIKPKLKLPNINTIKKRIKVDDLRQIKKHSLQKYGENATTFEDKRQPINKRIFFLFSSRQI